LFVEVSKRRDVILDAYDDGESPEETGKVVIMSDGGGVVTDAFLEKVGFTEKVK